MKNILLRLLAKLNLSPLSEVERLSLALSTVLVKIRQTDSEAAYTAALNALVPSRNK